MAVLPISAVFEEVPDPRRQTENRRHLLGDILTIATCAVLGGAESWEAIAEYGSTKEAFFRRFLELPNGVPSPDTFARVFARLDPAAFSSAFGRWLAAACSATGLVPVAIDGKCARAARRDTATGCLTLVSAWACESRLTLGQVAVADGSNEVAAIPELLAALDLKGAVVTIDAAGCQLENARLVRRRKGHYLLQVKANQPTLLNAIQEAFDAAGERDFVGVGEDGCSSEDRGHGRLERRYVTVLTDPAGLPGGWPDVKAIVQVDREREVDGKRTCTTHYYLSSHAGTAQEMAALVRGHWGIESMHWVLDVVFHEDQSRVREGHAGANLALLRKVAVSLLRRAPGKGTTPTKRLKAGWDDDFLLQVLQGISSGEVR